MVFPRGDEIFNALNTTNFDKVHVVILGQDPYHGRGRRMAFHFRCGRWLLPLVFSISMEIVAEYGGAIPRSGDLTRWAVIEFLLLNATLTVRQAQAGSHQNKGWERVPMRLSARSKQRREYVVFCCGVLMHKRKARSSTAPTSGFKCAASVTALGTSRLLGCGHFKEANDYLSANDYAPIGQA